MSGPGIRGGRFHTKVLTAVVVVMVLLVAATMYLVNQRITRQLQTEAENALRTADSVFRSLQQVRARSLQSRFRSIASEPRYRAACQLNDPKTLRPLLKELLGEELGGDLVQYRPQEGGVPTIVWRDPTLDLEEFARHSDLSSKQAIEGFANADTIRVSGRVFDIVSVPVRTPTGEDVMGALTFCVRLGETEAKELSQITGAGIVLLANDNVAASSLERSDLSQQCRALFGTAQVGTAEGFKVMREIVIPREHFRVLVGTFRSKSGDPKLGYVLLFSYEKALQDLRVTQQTIVAVSVFGILASSIALWFLVRGLTRPLRDLRDSAEAVGRGDFSQHVNVRTDDECGELAAVFNRMTDSLRQSRQQLDETFNTLKNTQAQLIQREKLSAIGEFVAGVTHELNNPLTSVLGFAELLQQTSLDERQRRFTERITQSARRCQKIVQSLLSFARQHQPERKPTSANELVEAVLEIMAYELRTSNIEVVKQLDPSLPKVMGDGHQLQQVFLNIVNNARQAIEERQTSGRIVMRTEQDGDRVRITFSDNGPGISEESLQKVFDPFFTTKEAGKGTGLGLSLSYGIIQEHGGTIAVRSKLGEGATFTIDLPAFRGADDSASTKPPEVTGSAANGSGRRVLVIDDEESILEFIAEVLQAEGYAVDTAANGDAALSHLRRSKYDLTLCDWKMPGLNGQQLYERIAAENVAVSDRFVFMTGDVINSRAEEFLRRHEKLCLPKPFSMSEFRAALANIAPPRRGH